METAKHLFDVVVHFLKKGGLWWGVAISVGAAVVTLALATAVVGALKGRGVTFEEYDYPSLKTVGGIADLGYSRAAWLKDSEGNLLGIAQLTP